MGRSSLTRLGGVGIEGCKSGLAGFSFVSLHAACQNCISASAPQEKILFAHSVSARVWGLVPASRRSEFTGWFPSHVCARRGSGGEVEAGEDQGSSSTHVFQRIQRRSPRSDGGEQRRKTTKVSVHAGAGVLRQVCTPR